jgi:hypothetical protein
MNRLAVSLLSLSVLPFTTLSAQQTPQPAPRIAASSFATTEVHVDQRPIAGRWFAEDAGLTGPARIAIKYGQPHARGRKVEAGLIPNDTVWRFGANEATTLHTDVDMQLGDLKLERGDYTLFVLQGAAGWQLIVNRRTAEWGTDYDKSKDIGRVALKLRTLAEPEETLSMYLVPDAQKPETGYAALQGTFKFKWGRSELSTPFQVSR